MNRDVSAKAPAAVEVIPFTATATTPVRVNTQASGVYEAVFCAEEDCFVIFGPSAAMPVADADSWPLFANVPTPFNITNQTAFISVIRDTVSGDLKYYIPGQGA